MKVSPDEELFLRHWMYDEVHYQDGQGPAKRLQIQNRVISADLAALAAAAIPDIADQEAAGLGPPPVEPPTWPWSEGALAARLAEARAALADGVDDPRERARLIREGLAGRAHGDSGTIQHEDRQR
jgi:hypothetical protein